MVLALTLVNLGLNYGFSAQVSTLVMNHTSPCLVSHKIHSSLNTTIKHCQVSHQTYNNTSSACSKRESQHLLFHTRASTTVSNRSFKLASLNH